MIGNAIGDFPIGGFPDSDSQSLADPLPGLLSDLVRRREFLLRSTPGGTTVDLSSGGYVSHPTDTPYQRFPNAIARPYNFRVDLPTPDLSGGASLSVGEILLNNTDKSLDSLSGLDWLGADLHSYIGNPSHPLPQFTEYSRSKSAGVSWDLNNITILQRDLRFHLKKRLQPNRYRGFGPCLRFDGASDYVSYGDILDRGASGSFTIEIMCRSSTLNTFKVLLSKGSSGSVGWFLYFTDTNNIFFQIRDSTIGALISTAATPYLDGKLRRFSGVCDRASQLLYLYIDGVLVTTPVSCSTIASIDNTSDLRVGAFGGGGLAMNGDMDDFRFWSRARTQSEIQADMHRELLGTETGLEIYCKFNEGSGTTAGDETANNRDGTITGATWVGSLEGDASISGTPKPVLLGIKRQIEPKLVDFQRRVYQLHDGPMQAIDEVADGGDAYTFGSHVSDIYASNPAAGTYNTCLAKGLFRLGSSPVGILTCIARGDNGGTLGYTDTLAPIHRKVVAQYGGSDDSELNLETYTDLESKTSAKIGFYFDYEINISDALDTVAKSGGNCWWSPDRVSKISVGRIDPPEGMIPVLSLSSDSLIEPNKGGAYGRVPIGVRVGQVVLGYRRYNTQLSADQVSGTVDLATRDDLSKEYRFVEVSDPDRSPESDTLTVYTEIDNPADARVEADRLLALWKVDRGIYSVTLDSGVLAYFVGTPIELSVDRYDTSGGKMFVVVGLSETMGQYGSRDRLDPQLFG